MVQLVRDPPPLKPPDRDHSPEAGMVLFCAFLGLLLVFLAVRCVPQAHAAPPLVSSIKRTLAELDRADRLLVEHSLLMAWLREPDETAKGRLP